MGGAYLSKPILEKISSKGCNEKVVFGASSMQGWRESQEDAHNCILDFDEDACLFAVYDGHGGSEVSKYTAQNLPDFLKQRKSYANKNYTEALIEAFLEFDDMLITEEAAVELKKLITPPKKISPWKRLDEIGMDDDEGPSTSSDDVVEENISELRQEAQMPISEVIIKKYPGAQEMLMKKLGTCDNPPSPYLRARCDNQAGPSGVSSSSGAGTSKMANLPTSTSEEKVVEKNGNADENGVCEVSSEKNEDTKADSDEAESDKTKSDKGESDKAESDKADSVKVESTQVESVKAESDNAKSVKAENGVSSNDDQAKELEDGAVADGQLEEGKEQAGEMKSDDGKLTNGKNDHLDESVDTNGITKEIENLTKKIQDGKRDLKTIRKLKKTVKEVMLAALLTQETESDDEADETFDPANFEEEEDEEDEDMEEEEEQSGEEGSEQEEGESFDTEGMDEEDDEEDDDMYGEMDLPFASTEKPGFDSGCTAVVALIKGDTLYVANAGDSRCILCKDGVAVDMSVDHKPEDELERKRITAAGGRVTYDGRVNGGLNLSRAIGDHTYKTNAALPNSDQMITALPDVKTHKLTNDVEFLVVACDGIWNSMTSQEVVDFVRPKLANGEDIAGICEAMFDKCVAPSTSGDGTGCDNMTCIIVKNVHTDTLVKAKAGAVAAMEMDATVSSASAEGQAAHDSEDKPATAQNNSEKKTESAGTAEVNKSEGASNVDDKGEVKKRIISCSDGLCELPEGEMSAAELCDLLDAEPDSKAGAGCSFSASKRPAGEARLAFEETSSKKAKIDEATD